MAGYVFKFNAFGLLSVILVHVVHPCIVNLIESIQVSYKVMFVYIVELFFDRYDFYIKGSYKPSRKTKVIK